MNTLFLCYRRAGAQTAKLLSFYIRRNYPSINVWYSDLETEGNYALDIEELMRNSYGVVIFLTKDFTKGFLTKDGKIIAQKFGSTRKQECITVQEVIEIEKNIQADRGFELHIVNLDGAVLSKTDQSRLESVFRQAGILKPDSVARYAQRNTVSFDTARDYEDQFFERMMGAYLPNDIHKAVEGTYSIGNYITSVDVLCWETKRFIPMNNITFSLSNEVIPFYSKIGSSRTQGEVLVQDDDVLSVVQFDQWNSTNEERKALHFSARIEKYSLFRKTLDLWNRNGFNMSREIAHYLNTREEKSLYTVPNAMGLALMVITNDNKLVFSRRSPKRRVRSNEFDCSIVEGLIPVIDKEVGREKVQYSFTSDDYVENECIRAFCEEICVDRNLESHIFGLILDLKYGQWNLIGLIKTGLSEKEINALHSTRDDTTEANKLYFVAYLDEKGNRDISKIKTALNLFRKDGFWDTALTVLCGTLLSLGFSQEDLNHLAD